MLEKSILYALYMILIASPSVLIQSDSLDLLLLIENSSTFVKASKPTHVKQKYPYLNLEKLSHYNLLIK